MIEHNHAWGESWDIYRDKSVWVVGFRGRKGGGSSMHYHETMQHTLSVTRGAMIVRLHGNFYRATPGCLTILRREEAHRLEFEEDTEGIETYYALPGHEIDPADIVRLSPAKAPE